MPGQRGSENRQLSQVVTLRMTADLSQRCAAIATEQGLSLAGWLRRIIADAAPAAQTPGTMKDPSASDALGNSKDDLAQPDMASGICGSISPPRLNRAFPPRTVLRKPERHVADLVRIADGLADLYNCLATLRQSHAILHGPSKDDPTFNDQRLLNEAIKLMRELSAFITARLEGCRNDQ
ncbi:hypothetical protein ACOSOMT5_P1902 [Acidiphilium sp. MT5]